MVKDQTKSPKRLHKGGDAVTIFEYKSPSRPDKVLALIVDVKKHFGKPFYEYISLSGLNQRQIQEARIYAEKIHQYHVEDRKQQLRSKLINTPANKPLSTVIGINFCVASIRLKSGGLSHELRISVSAAEGHNLVNDQAPVPSKQYEITRRIVNFDYPWFVQAWNRACRVRARAIGLKRTPSQWLKGIASEKEVARFIEKRIRDNLKKNKQGTRHAG